MTKERAGLIQGFPARMTSFAVAALLAASVAPDAWAQSYPTKPINLIIPFATGGGSERVSRLIAAEVEKTLGQPMIPEFRPGASGSLGAAAAAKAAPDGYTLTLAAAGTMTVLPQVDNSLGYDPVKDLQPVVNIYSAEIPISVRADSPAKNLKELIALAKASPGKLTYGHSGNFGIPHIAMELLKNVTGTQILAVPYRSEGPAALGFLSGDTDIGTVGYASIAGHIKEGKVRVLAQLGRTRVAQMADVPTAIEQGFPNLTISSWVGMLAPAKTPPDIVAKLNGAVVKALQVSTIKDAIEGLGYGVIGNSPQEYAAQIGSEIAALKKVIDEQNLAKLER